jgi:hypothetical protein
LRGANRRTPDAKLENDSACVGGTSGIRTWRVKKYPRWLIFYRINNHGGLVLLRVRSGTMNLPVLVIRLIETGKAATEGMVDSPRRGIY